MSPAWGAAALDSAVETDAVRESVRRLATAGNAAALAVLCVLVAAWPRLFEPGPMATAGAGDLSPALQIGPERPEGVLLIVVDGLRLDTARDAGVMPALHALAGGEVAEARVEAIIPSTLSGIRAMVEGVTPPAGAALLDLWSPPARAGGILEAVAGGGGGVAVAGPRLWMDLYGRWVDAAAIEPFGSRADAGVATAAEAWLRRGEHRLVIAHLGALDWAAHEHGPGSAAYRSAAAAADDAIRRLASAAGERFAVLVTSDHGTTSQGGHAGAEPSVTRVPLVLRWRDARLSGRWRQTDTAGLVGTLLGERFEPPVTPRAELSPVSVALASGAVVAACFIIAAAATSMESVGSLSFVLNASLWAALVTAFIWPPLGAGLAMGMLLYASRVAGGGVVWLVPALAAGVAGGGMRLLSLEGWLAAAVCAAVVALAAGGGAWRLAVRAMRTWVADGATLLPLLAVSALVVGWRGAAGVVASFLVARLVLAAAGDRRPAVLATGGAALSLGIAAGHGLAGEGVSLSSIPVRGAVGLLALPGGVAWTVLAVTAAQLAPALAAARGAAPLLAGRPPRVTGLLLAGVAAVCVAQAAFGASVLLLSDAVAAQALGLGLLLRGSWEALALAMGVAGFLSLEARLSRATTTASPAPPRARRPRGTRRATATSPPLASPSRGPSAVAVPPSPPAPQAAPPDAPGPARSRS